MRWTTDPDAVLSIRARRRQTWSVYRSGLEAVAAVLLSAAAVVGIGWGVMLAMGVPWP